MSVVIGMGLGENRVESGPLFHAGFRPIVEKIETIDRFTICHPFFRNSRQRMNVGVATSGGVRGRCKKMR